MGATGREGRKPEPLGGGGGSKSDLELYRPFPLGVVEPIAGTMGIEGGMGGITDREAR